MLTLWIPVTLRTGVGDLMGGAPGGHRFVLGFPMLLQETQHLGARRARKVKRPTLLSSDSCPLLVTDWRAPALNLYLQQAIDHSTTGLLKQTTYYC